MEKEEIDIILKIFDAIEDDWAICDDRDEDNHMVLVNEDNDIKEDLKPSKSLIYKLEKEGLIALNESISDKRDSKREFMESLKGGEIPVPFVFFFTVTAKGNLFRDEQSKP